MEPIYLDYNATTPLDPAVAAAMRPYLKSGFGNPSSNHVFGASAREAVDLARERVARLVGARADEIVFTSGGSEANNLALVGAVRRQAERGNQIITSAVEHPAISEVCRYLAGEGFRISVLPVDDAGLVDPADLEDAITPSTLLVSVMHANNEVGTVQPIRALADIAHRYGALMHTDAAQSIGKIITRVDDLGVDLLTIAGHKFYGPKGVGALYVRRGVKIDRLIHGAGHERGRRAGTENVLGLVGLGMAAELAHTQLASRAEHLRRLRDRLHEGLLASVADVQLNGHAEQRLPNTLNLSFGGLRASELLAAAEGIAASAGAACHSGGVTISATLQAMGLTEERAAGAVRFSTGTMLTGPEVEQAVEIVADAVQAVRAAR